jgi:hypothetical protein
MEHSMGVFVEIEPPVRGFMCPRGVCWTKFQFVRAQVQPVDVFVK